MPPIAANVPEITPPRPEWLRKRVVAVAATTERVIFTNHALDRMGERGIADVDVLRVLRNGRIDTKILPGKTPGEWTVKMIDRVKGSREIGVVTAVIAEERLVIVTVEWEDVR
jgi:hypothetical protein